MDSEDEDVVTLAHVLAAKIGQIPYGAYTPHTERDEVIIARTLISLASLLSHGKPVDPHQERALRVLGLTSA
jgi:hypothetical protein